MSIRLILNKIFGVKNIFRLRYFRQRLRWPDLDNPKDYSEILISQLLSDEFLKYAEFTDKIKVRDYVTAKGLGHILLEHYGHYESFDEIDPDLLPDKFVLKSNRGSSAKDVCICNDKNTFDWKKAKRKIEKGMRHQYEYEPHYNIIEPRIICEELVDCGEGKLPNDYKFLCVHGKIAYIVICWERETGSPTYTTVDVDWNVLPYMRSKHISKTVAPKPALFGQMAEVAEILAADFEMVRVDLYEYKGQVRFGELTFSPDGGILYSHTDQELEEIGELIRNGRKPE